MSIINDNSPTMFLRTQSYIVNGKPNPLSHISRRKYFSNFIQNYDRKQKEKTKTVNNKKYINKIKNSKKKIPFSTSKFKKKNIQKLKTKEKEENKNDMINEKTNYKFSKYSLNYNALPKEKEKDKEINQINHSINKEKEYITKNNLINEVESEVIPKKKKDFFINILKDEKSKFPIYNSNNINYPKNNSFKREFCLTTEKDKYFYNNDVSDLFSNIFNNKNEKKYALNIVKTKNNINCNNKINYGFSEKLKKNKKIFFSKQNEDKFLDKLLLKDNEDYLNINNKNNNNLLDKLNHFKKRENSASNYNYKDNNKTKYQLKLMKKSIDKNSLSKINIVSKKENYKITEINEIKNIKNYNSSNNFNKNNHKQLNIDTNLCFIRNNNFSPVLTDYNIYDRTDLLKPDFDIFSKSLSNAICAMRDERDTNKFIKELNKNKKNINSNKIINFSFNKEKTEELNDNFYSPLKSQINKISLGYNINKNIKINIPNKSIKKNTSFDSYRKNSMKINFKSNFNIINNRLYRCINYNTYK